MFWQGNEFWLDFWLKRANVNWLINGKKDPYIVVENPVYRVGKSLLMGKIRTLHKNFLLPFMCISDNDVDSNDKFNYSVNKTGISVIK